MTAEWAHISVAGRTLASVCVLGLPDASCPVQHTHTETQAHTHWPQSAVRYDWHPAARTFAGLAAAAVAAAAVADRQLNSYRQYKYFI